MNVQENTTSSIKMNAEHIRDLLSGLQHEIIGSLIGFMG